jgi:hypothetical protein
MASAVPNCGKQKGAHRKIVQRKLKKMLAENKWMGSFSPLFYSSLTELCRRITNFSRCKFNSFKIECNNS